MTGLVLREPELRLVLSAYADDVLLVVQDPGDLARVEACQAIYSAASSARVNWVKSSGLAVGDWRQRRMTGLVLREPELRLVLSAYADDVLLVVQDPGDLARVEACQAIYSAASSARVNWVKSSGLAVGDWRQRRMTGLVLREPELRLVLSAYADDVLLVVQDPGDLARVEACQAIYSAASSARVNWVKSSGLAVGDWRQEKARMTGLVLREPELRLVLSAYADDVLLVVQDPGDLARVEACQAIYSAASSARVNWVKSSGLAVGDWRQEKAFDRVDHGRMTGLVLREPELRLVLSAYADDVLLVVQDPGDLARVEACQAIYSAASSARVNWVKSSGLAVGDWRQAAESRTVRQREKARMTGLVLREPELRLVLSAYADDVLLVVQDPGDLARVEACQAIYSAASSARVNWVKSSGLAVGDWRQAAESRTVRQREKAFDRVDHGYLLSTLQAFGFGPQRMTGLVLREPELRLVLSAYADDVLLVVQDPGDLARVEACQAIYSAASSARVNWVKSSGLAVGDWRQCFPRDLSGLPDFYQDLLRAWKLFSTTRSVAAIVGADLLTEPLLHNPQLCVQAAESRTVRQSRLHELQPEKARMTGLVLREPELRLVLSAYADDVLLVVQDPGDLARVEACQAIYSAASSARVNWVKSSGLAVGDWRQAAESRTVRQRKARMTGLVLREPELRLVLSAYADDVLLVVQDPGDLARVEACQAIYSAASSARVNWVKSSGLAVGDWRQEKARMTGLVLREPELRLVLSAYADDVLLVVQDPGDLARVEACQAIYSAASSARVNWVKSSGLAVGDWRQPLLHNPQLCVQAAESRTVRQSRLHELQPEKAFDRVDHGRMTGLVLREPELRLVLSAYADDVLLVVQDPGDLARVEACQAIYSAASSARVNWVKSSGLAVGDWRQCFPRDLSGLPDFYLDLLRAWKLFSTTRSVAAIVGADLLTEPLLHNPQLCVQAAESRTVRQSQLHELQPKARMTGLVLREPELRLVLSAYADDVLLVVQDPGDLARVEACQAIYSAASSARVNWVKSSGLAVGDWRQEKARMTGLVLREPELRLVLSAYADDVLLVVQDPGDLARVEACQAIYSAASSARVNWVKSSGLAVGDWRQPLLHNPQLCVQAAESRTVRQSRLHELQPEKAFDRVDHGRMTGLVLREPELRLVLSAYADDVLLVVQDPGDLARVEACQAIYSAASSARVNWVKSSGLAVGDWRQCFPRDLSGLPDFYQDLLRAWKLFSTTRSVAAIVGADLLTEPLLHNPQLCVQAAESRTVRQSRLHELQPEKAFDRVDHGYLLSTLQAFGFGPQRMTGLVLREPELRLVLSAYADDVLLVVQDPGDLARVEACQAIYSAASSARVNWVKSSGLAVGDWRQGFPRDLSGLPDFYQDLLRAWKLFSTTRSVAAIVGADLLTEPLLHNPQLCVQAAESRTVRQREKARMTGLVLREPELRLVLSAYADDVLLVVQDPGDLARVEACQAIYSAASSARVNWVKSSGLAVGDWRQGFPRDLSGLPDFYQDLLRAWKLFSTTRSVAAIVGADLLTEPLLHNPQLCVQAAESRTVRQSQLHELQPEKARMTGLVLREPELRLVLSAYADDVLLVVQDPGDLARVEACQAIYSAASSARVNWVKSSGLAVGDWRQREKAFDRVDHGRMTGLVLREPELRLVLSAYADDVLLVVQDPGDLARVEACQAIYSAASSARVNWVKSSGLAVGDWRQGFPRDLSGLPDFYLDLLRAWKLFSTTRSVAAIVGADLLTEPLLHNPQLCVQAAESRTVRQSRLHELQPEKAFDRVDHGRMTGLVLREPELRLVLSAYADDVLLVVQDPGDLARVEACQAIYSAASSARVNWVKSSGLAVGDWRQREKAFDRVDHGRMTGLVLREPELRLVLSAYADDVLLVVQDPGDLARVEACQAIYSAASSARVNWVKSSGLAVGDWRQEKARMTGLVLREPELRLVLSAYADDVLLVVQDPGDLARVEACQAIYSAASSARVNWVKSSGLAVGDWRQAAESRTVRQREKAFDRVDHGRMTGLVLREPELRLVLSAYADDVLLVVQDPGDLARVEACQAIYSAASSARVNWVKSSGLAVGDWRQAAESRTEKARMTGLVLREPELRLVLSAYADDVLLVVQDPGDLARVEACQAIYSAASSARVNWVKSSGLAVGDWRQEKARMTGLVLREPELRLVLSAYADDVLLVVQDPGDLARVEACQAIYSAASSARVNWVKSSGLAVGDWRQEKARMTGLVLREPELRLVLSAYADDVLLVVQDPGDLARVKACQAIYSAASSARVNWVKSSGLAVGDWRQRRMTGLVLREPELRLVLLAYADDVLLVVQDPGDLARVEACQAIYSAASSARVNWVKSSGLAVGDWRQARMTGLVLQELELRLVLSAVTG
ncbi:unnamed protein product [Lepidochelys olivacea]